MDIELAQNTKDSIEEAKAKDASSNILDWLNNHIVHPFVNAAIIDPHNTLANVVNKISPNSLSKWQEYESHAPETVSQWTFETMSHGLGGLAPYVISGIAMSFPLRFAAKPFTYGSYTGKVLRSHHTAQIAGAGAYDYNRDTRNYETHEGNALAGLAAFSVLQGANFLSKDFSLLYRIPSLAFAGVAGGLSQILVSKGYSAKELPSQDEIWQATLSGGFMNLFLPTAQHLGYKAISKINTLSGRGEPLDRFIKNEEKQPSEIHLLFGSARNTNSRESSSINWNIIKAQMADSKEIRVLEGNFPSAIIPKDRLIFLNSADKSAQKIAHELKHQIQYDTGQLERGFKSAETELLKGNKKEAEILFRNTIIEAELEARAAELGKSTIERKNIEQDLSPFIAKELEQFFHTNGKYRPEKYFQKFSPEELSSRTFWETKLDTWFELSQKEKLYLVRELEQAPIDIRIKVIRQALLNPGEDLTEPSRIFREARVWSLREQADLHFAKLPAKARNELWQEMIEHNNYHIRVLAIARIAQLESGDRLNAYNTVLKSKLALKVEYPERLQGIYEKSEYTPGTPGWHNNKLNPLFRKTPAALLIESIASLNSGDRYYAWQRARSFDNTVYDNKDLHARQNPYIISDPAEAAIRNLSVLPPSERTKAWFSFWQQSTIETFHRMRKTDIESDWLVKQIPDLPAESRPRAMHAVFVSNASLKGNTVKAAIESLAESDRLPVWQKLFLRSSDAWENIRHKYEADYFSDQIAESKLRRKHRSSGEFFESWQRLDKEVGKERDIDIFREGTFAQSTQNIPRGLGSSIAALEIQDRLNAWQAVLKLNSKIYANELIATIPSLPESSQAPALKLLLEKQLSTSIEATETILASNRDRFAGRTWSRRRGTEEQETQTNKINPYEFAQTVKTMPVQHWPNMIEAIMTALPVNSEHRAKLLESIPISSLIESERFNWKPSQAEIEQRAADLTKIFQAGLKHAKETDYRAIAHWWNEVIHLEPIDQITHKSQSVLRDILIDRLKPTDLTRMILSRTYSEALDEYALKDPQMAKDLSKKYFGTFLAEEGLESERRMMSAVVKFKQDNSLISTLKIFFEPYTEKTRWGDPVDPNYALLGEMFHQLAKHSTENERINALKELSHKINESKSNDRSWISEETSQNMLFAFPLDLAIKLRELEPQAFNKHFAEPLIEQLGNKQKEYAWQMAVAREIGRLHREGTIPPEVLRLPNMRMSKIELEENERARLKEEFKQALFEPERMKFLLGEGPLGRLFPNKFGRHDTEEGILGRPQHGAHEYNLDEHIFEVMKKTRDNPLMEMLSKRDQEDVLAAAFLHDIEKLAGMSDEAHQWAATNTAWGILRTLDISPIRIQRITNLIARHNETSFGLNELYSDKLKSKEYLDDLATFYRHPYAILQLRILNEADIKSISRTSKQWFENPKVEEELDTIVGTLARHSLRLQETQIPLLTSATPNKFGLFSANKAYAYLAHVSQHINESFLKQLQLIESPEYSISSTLVTNNYHKLYHNGQPTFAIVSGPFEHISQAYRENLGTGYSVDWNGHVKLVQNWSERPEANAFAKALDDKARQLKISGTTKTESKLNSLAKARKELSQFDSLDDLHNLSGRNNPLLEFQLEIQRLLTTAPDGGALKGHNEIKLNNPTVSGLGIRREGKKVYFEDMPESVLHTKLIQNNESPNWLLTGKLSGSEVPKDTIVIPKSTWQTLIERDLPIIVLDP